VARCPMASHVFVTRPLPAPGIDLLNDSGFDVRSNPEDRPLSREQLLVGVREADALICMLSDRIDVELLDSAPALKVIANYAVGYDNIDVSAARKRGVEVTNTPGVLTEATADLAWALLLAAARNLGAGERMVRAGEWTGWGPMQLLGEPLQGRTLGIVGMGAIGQAVARRGKGFGMEIVYFNRNRVAPEIESSLGAEFVSFEELLRRSDFLSLHAPLNEHSRHLFNQQTFQLMKSSAVLVNTARGALIDEVELVAALRDGRLAAAGLDVYEFEPKITEGLLGLDNVVLAPHLGSASTLARGDMVRVCCENVTAVLAGGPAITPVPT